MLRGFFVILLFQLIGEVIQKFFALVIPGPVIGLIFLLFTLIYLRRVDTSYDDVDNYGKKKNDFVNFIEQYAERREKPLQEYMPNKFLNWYEDLKNGE